MIMRPQELIVGPGWIRFRVDTYYDMQMRCVNVKTINYVALMIDGMATKKHTAYDPQTQLMSGYVDMGDGANQTAIAS